MATRAKKEIPAETRRSNSLRAMPSTDECLGAASGDRLLQSVGRNYLKEIIRRAQSAIRDNLAHSRNQFERGTLLEMVLGKAHEIARADEPAMRPVVNATGVVLHTNIGRALLAEAAIEAIEMAARSAVNLEFDLVSGGRGDRDSLVEADLCALTGAEAATVVNNNAAAVLLALNTLADGREVIVSRGELIEIGGSFRIPDVMARSGARLREVGTTNRTHRRDYADAIGPETALLLKVHPSNYRIVGFTTEVSLAELAQIGAAHNVEVIEDLGAGALLDMSVHGLPREPVVAERIAAGAGVVTFSGDKLLGGPQAGIIVGRKPLIEKMRANPLKRALRCDKLTLAALAATLRIYRRSPDPWAELPTLRILRRSVGELETVAARAREILSERLGPAFRVDVVDGFSEIGSGALPTEQLPTIAVRIQHESISADSIAALFRHASPAIIGRIHDGAFRLDMRTIENPAVFAVEFPPPHRRD